MRMRCLPGRHRFWALISLHLCELICSVHWSLGYFKAVAGMAQQGR